MPRLTTAKLLLEIKAVNFRPEEPYTLTSGWKSPVYIDCRKIIFFPRARAKICDLAVEKISRHIGYETIQAVAGGETAGIPFAAWIAERMGAPMAYIRKQPKGFGRNALIEGDVPESMNTLLVEDLTTDGGSKNPVRQGAARGRGDLQPHLRGVLLRRIPRQLRDAGEHGYFAAPSLHLVGRAGSRRRTSPISPTRPWPGCASSWKTRWPGRRRMAASPPRKRRWRTSWVRLKSKQPLFEKSGAKTFLCWVVGVVGCNAHDPG